MPDGGTVQAPANQHNGLQSPAHLSRTFSPAPSTSASLRRNPLSRLFKKRQSRADLLGPPGPSFEQQQQQSSSSHLAKPQKLLGEIDLQQDEPPRLRRVRSKRSFPSLSALFRVGNQPDSRHQKYGSSPLPGRTSEAEEESIPRSPLPREMTKSPSMSMLFQAAHQGIDDMMAESSYVPVPGNRRSLIVPSSPSPHRSRSTPDLFSHSRIGSVPSSSMPSSPAASRFPNDQATLPRHSTYTIRSPPSLPLPSIKSPSSLPHAPVNATRITVQRPLSPPLRKPVPKLSDDLARLAGASGGGSTRLREATKSSLPYLESRSPSPGAAALPPSPTLPSAATAVEPTVTSPTPARLLVKPITMRPLTAGTFGRPSTGNASERPDTGASVQSKNPADIKVPGRLRRITDGEDDDEEVPDTPASKCTIISLDIGEYEAELDRLCRDDSGYANLSDMASPIEAGSASKADTPSSSGFPADALQGDTVFDLRKSLASMEKQDSVSVLSDLEQDWDHRLSRSRDDCLEALGSADGHAAEELPAVAALPQETQEAKNSLSLSGSLTRTGRLYESLMKESLGSLQSSTASNATPRVVKKDGNTRLQNIFLDKSLAASSHPSSNEKDSPGKKSYLSTESPLKRITNAQYTNPLSISSQFDWISRPPTPLVTKGGPDPVKEDKPAVQPVDHYATSYFPPYETLLPKNVVPVTPSKESPASSNPMLTPVFGPSKTRSKGGTSEISKIPRSSHSSLQDHQSQAKTKADHADTKMKALEEENKQLRRMLDILVRRSGSSE